MVHYVYILKCPGCEDEFFDFFDEAKEQAMSILSKRPIITQTEYENNNMGCGECIGSHDLGTVWSWDEVMNDVTEEPTDTTFTKADTLRRDNCFDQEFNNLDNSLDYIPDNFRKPVPSNMTVGELVEAMEENEDTVECRVCEELFEKVKCHKDPKLGWVCEACSSKQLKESTTTRWTCFFDDREVGTVEATTEEEAKDKMMQKYPEYQYGLYDGCFYVERDKESLTEAFNPNESIEFEYNDLKVVLYGHKVDVDRWDESEEIVNYTYTKSKLDVATDIWENFITDSDVIDIPGGLEQLDDDVEWEKFLETHFDDLVEKYYKQLLEYYRDDAREEYEETHSIGESCSGKSFLEELEESDSYRSHLIDCPECGASQAFDHEAGLCLDCGFNAILDSLSDEDFDEISKVASGTETPALNHEDILAEFERELANED